jgi:hypothetical protein
MKEIREEENDYELSKKEERIVDSSLEI